jgi:hypothetical protein
LVFTLHALRVARLAHFPAAWGKIPYSRAKNSLFDRPGICFTTWIFSQQFAGEGRRRRALFCEIPC